MEKLGTETAVKVSSYETSRTRRSLVEGTNEDSNDGNEFASSGFYVREKTNEKKVESPGPTVCNEDHSKENGISVDTDHSSSPLENGENSTESTRETVEDPQTDDPIISLEITHNGACVVNETPDGEALQGSEAVNIKKRGENKHSTESNPGEETKQADVCIDQANDISENLPASNVEDYKENEENGSVDAKLSVEEADKVHENAETEEEEDKDASIQMEINANGNVEECENTQEKSDEENPEIIDSDEGENVEVKQRGEGDLQSEEKSQEEAEKSDRKLTEETLQIENKSIGKDECKPTGTSVEIKKTKAGFVKNRNNKSDVKNTVTDLTGDDPPAKSKTSDKIDNCVQKEQLLEAGATYQDTDADEDFDPSLFCPDISMDVDEAAVVANEEHDLDSGSSSSLLYEPIFSTLVDEMTGAEVEVNLTPLEMELRQKMYGPDNPVQASKVHCTACNVHLGSSLIGANNRFVHPLLKVLICKNCYHFYTSGEFEKDEDGSELYCRWCGQGGEVLCCSSCEFVFCKRCIKNNFGLKKFKEIRNSDDWNCFRCDPGQLSSLRASCAEFMEYYRTELARAHTLAGTNPDLMTTDYTKCCSTPVVKKEESNTSVVQKVRRKRKEEDPDYSPITLGEPPAKKLSTGEQGYTTVPAATAIRALAPKPISTPLRPINPSGFRPQGAQGAVFKVGNTTFRNQAPGNAGYTIQGTKSGTSEIITIPSSSGKSTTPGYIKLIPQSRMTLTRLQGPNSTGPAGSSGNIRPGITPVRPANPPGVMPAMKHEWFEKTVRAAARVNSNLSYTLTQLNRQQSQAGSVEALAVVHNKLQEVLSTSINSLIQIRKNLRTEFIAGIKNIKFPLKPAAPPKPTGAVTVKDDDDVIFVNPTTVASNNVKKISLPQLIIPPTVTLTRKVVPSTSSSSITINKINKTPAASIPTSSPPVKGRGFLKVRSLTALQSVPTECIVIPDDPPAVKTSPKSLLKIQKAERVAEPIARRKSGEKSTKSQVEQPKKLFNVLMVYDVKKQPSPEIQQMMNAVVMVTRSPQIENMLESEEKEANCTVEID
ncbi:uncharacterized protein [Euwallacea fornicatus]|uniref:uncharacterized protein isoform X4 n=1 Tax=Euwallacea fornicatus TaxID=995702 RepID=UPI00338E1169